jgi:hypothetical protein
MFGILTNIITGFNAIRSGQSKVSPLEIFKAPIRGSVRGQARTSTGEYETHDIKLTQRERAISAILAGATVASGAATVGFGIGAAGGLSGIGSGLAGAGTKLKGLITSHGSDVAQNIPTNIPEDMIPQDVPSDVVDEEELSSDEYDPSLDETIPGEEALD